VIDLVDVPISAGGLETKIPILRKLLSTINQLPNPTGEFGGAVPISTALIIIVIAIYFTHVRYKSKSFLNSGRFANQLFIASYLTLILCFSFILKDFRGINLWSFTFYDLPFLGSIRVLSRFMLFACLLIPFLIGYCADEFLRMKSRAPKSIYCGFLLIVVFLSQGTQTYGTFNQKDLDVTTNVEKEVSERCKSFYLIPANGEEESIPVYLPPDIALQISVNSNVPTINGNSSFLPSDYPLSLLVQKDRAQTLRDLNAWVSRFELRNVCLVSISLKTQHPIFKIAGIIGTSGQRL
jgi:hypothetical protein